MPSAFSNFLPTISLSSNMRLIFPSFSLNVNTKSSSVPYRKLQNLLIGYMVYELYKEK